MQFEGLLAALHATRQPSGYRRKGPDPVHAGIAYDHRRCHTFLSIHGISVWIARRARYRKLMIRYERKPEIHVAFLALACVLVCPGKVG